MLKIGNCFLSYRQQMSLPFCCLFLNRSVEASNYVTGVTFFKNIY